MRETHLTKTAFKVVPKMSLRIAGLKALENIEPGSQWGFVSKCFRGRFGGNGNQTYEASNARHEQMRL